MAVSFKEDEVEITCNECSVKLLSFAKINLTLVEAINFADRYKDVILCKHCTSPEVIPEVLH